MNNYYITYDEYLNSKKFYSLDTSASSIKSFELQEREILDLLIHLVYNVGIDDVIDAGDAVKVVFYDSTMITIDSLKVFSSKYPNVYDLYLSRLLKKIQKFIEDKEIREYKNSLLDETIKKVNRGNPRFSKTAKIVVGTGLFLSLVMPIVHNAVVDDNVYEDNAEGALSQIVINENHDEYDTFKLIEIEEPEVIPEMTPLEPEEDLIEDAPTYIEDDAIKIEYSFEDLTEDGRLETATINCASYLDPLIERYGLPKEVTYAICAREHGHLDTYVNSLGSCGPMQIQVGALHGEYFKVPVYENGVLTGEYDEFYAVDARIYGEPTYAGKKALFIQNLEDHFKISCALIRRAIDKYNNLFIAIDAYNKGLYALEIAGSDDVVTYYKENPNDFGWLDIVPNYYGKDYGDPNYLKHVLSYVKMEDRSETTISFYCQGELVKYDLTNTYYLNEDVSYTDTQSR